MKKLVLVLMAASLTILAWGPAAQAIGTGVYFSGGVGSGTFEWDDDNDSFDSDEKALGVGFVMDTAVRNQSPFNYRLQIGYEALDLKDEFDTTLEMGGVVLDNTFGFAMVQTPNFRLWGGPQIRLGYFTGESDTKVLGEAISVDLAAVGVGLALGANFGITESFALGATLGVRATGYAGTGEWRGESDNLTGRTTVGFVNLCLLFGY